MKSALLILFGYLINTATIAFDAHKANYELAINGFSVANEVRTLSVDNQRYFYTADAKTSGLIAKFKDYLITANATFVINNQGVDSIHYQIIENEDGKQKKNYAINIDSKRNSVSSIITKSRPKPTIWKSQTGNIVDPLSLILALAYDLKKYPKKMTFSYQVADGKSLKPHRYQKISSNETLMIAEREITVIKIEKIGDQDEKTLAYFAPAYQYLPVLIKQTKKGNEYSYKLTKLEGLN